MDQPYASTGVFSTPPMHQHSVHSEPSPGSYQDHYGQQDLADILGALKVDEAGTGLFHFLTYKKPSIDADGLKLRT